MRFLTLLKTSLATGVLLTSGVVAGGAAVAAPAPLESSPTALCHVTALYGNTPINASSTTSSAVIGHLTKGVRTASACARTINGYYNACNGGSNYWVYIIGGGYVKAKCVSLTIDA
jgi:hypothetical protein